MRGLVLTISTCVLALIIAIRALNSDDWKQNTGSADGVDFSEPLNFQNKGKLVCGLERDVDVSSEEKEIRSRLRVGSGLPSFDGTRKGLEKSRLEQLLGKSTDGVDTGNRVRDLQEMRGGGLSSAEREAALEFLAGKDLPEDMTRGSIDWVSDELLTVLRLQEPRWEGLAGELGAVAFQPGTNPVTRDYIMQHLGHIWEETGARKEIDKTLWRAVGSTDETTPGTALIALNGGYGRDGNRKGLVEVRDRALGLAQNTGTPLATRVTALSIAGEGGGAEVREFATKVLGNQETPLILRKVAERTREVGP